MVFKTRRDKISGIKSEVYFMTIAIIISSNDPETVWNALRAGISFQRGGDRVKVFLIGHGVEAELAVTDDFDTEGRLAVLVEEGCQVYACGSCMDRRGMEGTGKIFRGNLARLHKMIKEADRVLSF